MVTRAVILIALLGTLGLAMLFPVFPFSVSASAGWIIQATTTSTPTSTPPAGKTLSPGDKTYTVAAGDTLGLIAKKFYGDSSKYPLIVRANNLRSLTLRVGTVLIIPAQDDESGTLGASTQSGTPRAATQTVTRTVAATGYTTRQASQTVTATGPAPIITVFAPPPVATKATVSPPSEPSPAPVRSTTTSLRETAYAMQTPITIALDVISGICLIAAFFLADRAYQTYRRALRTERRVMMAHRVYSADEELYDSLNQPS